MPRAPRRSFNHLAGSECASGAKYPFPNKLSAAYGAGLRADEEDSTGRQVS